MVLRKRLGTSGSDFAHEDPARPEDDGPARSPGSFADLDFAAPGEITPTVSFCALREIDLTGPLDARAGA